MNGKTAAALVMAVAIMLGMAACAGADEESAATSEAFKTRLQTAIAEAEAGGASEAQLEPSLALVETARGREA